MSQSNFNMRLDDELRARAYPVLARYGLTPSQAVRLFFNQIGETGKIPLSFDWANEGQLSANGERLLRESIADLNNGRYSEYSADELKKQGLVDSLHE